jgi:hypothetical protein
MKKKASLSLSVNAIVILILAIVMLGLGLGFIRGMFSKVSTQVEEAVAAEPEPSVPTASNPITLSREMVITNAESKEIIKISTFNPSNESWSTAPTIECMDLTISDQSANTKTVNQGEFATFNLLVTIPSSAPNTHLCQMTIKGYAKDMTIKIVE